MSIEEIINHLDVLACAGEEAEENGRVRDVNGANAAALREAIALLKTHQEDWIRVENRLPEPYEKVLAFHRGHVCSIIRLEHIDFDGRFEYAKYSGPVTHWMPVPELPKED